MNNLTVKFVKMKPNAIVPRYQTEHAAAMDIHACLTESIVLEPMGRIMVPTGIGIELPIGYEAQIRARSGLSIKNGITMVNGIGTIDADYRGEVGVLVINLGSESFEIEPGMRIAQMVVAKYEHVAWAEVESLGLTDRGTAGYGSTGTRLTIDKKV